MNGGLHARLTFLIADLPARRGHLFISVLAYHFVHTLRLQLKAQGNDDSWETLRQTIAHAAARDGHHAAPR